jgi:hypothetical protein
MFTLHIPLCCVYYKVVTSNQYSPAAQVFVTFITIKITFAIVILMA